MAFYVEVTLLAAALSSVIAYPEYAAPGAYSPQPAAYSAQPAAYSAQPAYAQQYSPPVPIISQSQEVNSDGSYAFSYQAGNGIAVEEKGYLKNAGVPDNEIQTAEGYFLYPGPDGNQYSVSYRADENGFVAAGAHLPTPPPPPPELVKAYAEAPKDDGAYDEQGYPLQKQPQRGYRGVEKQQAKTRYA